MESISSCKVTQNIDPNKIDGVGANWKFLPGGPKSKFLIVKAAVKIISKCE